jgi:hypothetical protein
LGLEVDEYPRNVDLVIIILIIIMIMIISIIVIIKFEKKILLLLKKNYRFNLKGKIKNYKNLGQTCLILLLLLIFSLLLI